VKIDGQIQINLDGFSIQSGRLVSVLLHGSEGVLIKRRATTSGDAEVV
jgi:hypothetical protein